MPSEATADRAETAIPFCQAAIAFDSSAANKWRMAISCGFAGSQDLVGCRVVHQQIQAGMIDVIQPLEIDMQFGTG